MANEQQRRMLAKLAPTDGKPWKDAYNTVKSPAVHAAAQYQKGANLAAAGVPASRIGGGDGGGAGAGAGAGAATTTTTPTPPTTPAGVCTLCHGNKRHKALADGSVCPRDTKKQRALQKLAN